MPKFAATTMMFNEVPFLDRFEAAAKAGFKAVEYLWPYDYPAEELKAKLEKYGLKQVLFNTAAGDVSNGEWGVSAIPNREADSHRDIDLALEYALALGCEMYTLWQRLCQKAKIVKSINRLHQKCAVCRRQIQTTRH